MRFLLIALLAVLAWKGYQHFLGDKAASARAAPAAAARASPQVDEVASEEVAVVPFRCDGRQHCSQMTSRAEAEFFVRHCPDTKMDGDHDGEPCENDSRF